MIVLFGSPDDLCVRLLYEYVSHHGIEAMLVPDIYHPTTTGFTWYLARPYAESYLVLNAASIPFASIAGVLNRQRYLLAAELETTQQDHQYMQQELDATLLGLFHALPCPVINRPNPVIADGPLFAHVENTKWVKQCGLQLPPVMMTSSYEKALHFYERYGQRALLGSPSQQFPSQLLVGPEGHHPLHSLIARQPVYIQAVPPGQWVQVFIVGDQAFGVEDQRQGATEKHTPEPLRAVVLSPGLQMRCRRLAQALQLDFACIHLLQTEHGEAYCFDVDPFPTYDRCDAQLQQQITIGLAALLMGDARSTA